MPQSSSATSDRIATLMREVAIAPTVERARERSEELIRALVDFYGEGLERTLDIVHEAAGDRSKTIFAALCEDRLVESLLALHDLHPLSLEDRVRHALASIRPYLESHEGDVEVVRVEDGIAYVRLSGSCDGCQSSAATLKLAVERAIVERVSEIAEVRAVSDTRTGDADTREVDTDDVGTGAEAVLERGRSLRLQSDWVELDGMPELAARGLARVTCAGTPVIFARRDETIYAYRDRCPSCTRALDGATLAWPWLRCAGCGERFDVVRAGRSEDDGTRQAEPFPLVRDGDRVRVAISLGV
ncbi:MAG: hypothetical protein NVS2B3_17430 [Vulcanimicrobiaceae bacterium]